MKTISQQVDSWITEEDLPTRANLKVIRATDPHYKHWPQEEIEAYKDFMQWHLAQEHTTLLLIPEPQNTGSFLPTEIDEFGNDTSAFNTHDFHNQHNYKFNKEHWAAKKLFEELKDIAITHSSVSQTEGKTNLKKRYDDTVERELKDRRDKLQRYYDERGWQTKNKVNILIKIARLNSHIKRARELWEEFAYWE